MSKLINDISYNFINRLVVAVLSLLAIPFLLSNLGEFQFGLFSLFSILILILVISDIGLSKSGVRFITLFWNKTNEKYIYSTLFFLTLFSCFVLIFFGVLLNKIILSFLIELDYNKYIDIYYLCLFITVMLIIRGYFISIVFSFQKYKFYNISNIIVEIIKWSLTVYVSYFSNPLKLIFIVHAISFLFHNIILYINTSQLISKKKFKIFDFPNIIICKQILSFSSKITIADLFQKITSYSDKILVSILGSISGLSFYYIAFQVVSKLNEIPSNILLVYYTKFGLSSANNDRNQLIKDFSNASRIISIIVIPIVINLFMTSNFLLKLWLHKESVENIENIENILNILCFGSLFSCLALPCFSLASAVGKPNYILENNVYSSIILILINIVLISNFGIIGAAYSWSIVQFFVLIFMSTKVSKYLKTDFKNYILKHFLNILLKIGFSFILIYILLSYFINNIALNLFVSNICIIIIIYNFILLPVEKQFLNSIIIKLKYNARHSNTNV